MDERAEAIVERYLEHVTTATSPDLDAAVMRIVAAHEALPGWLDAAGTERAAGALAHLARMRLLASNTLMQRGQTTDEAADGEAAAARRDRAAWDRANAWVAEAITRTGGAPLGPDELLALQRISVGAPNVRLRDEPLFSCGLAYLPAERVATELGRLDGRLRGSSRPALLIAAATYIAVVTIHPFDNGNGRISRLAADKILLGNGFLPLCFLSPVASHVAQMTTPSVDANRAPTRDPARALEVVLAAVETSYRVVRERLAESRLEAARLA